MTDEPSADLFGGSRREGSREEPVEEQRRGAILSWVELAGQFHSNFTEVSTDKYRHLADVYER
jgi:hypothetical protein